LSNDKAQEYFKKTVLPIIVALSKYEDIGDNHNLKTVRPLDINYARKIAYMYNVKEKSFLIL